MTSYSQSQEPHKDVRGTPEQVCFTSPMERLTLISGGNAASVTYVDPNGHFQNIYFPHLMRSLNHEDILSIYGNVSDKQGEYALFEIAYSNSGFNSILLKDDIDPGLLDSELLPSEALVGTAFADKQAFGLRLPPFVPSYFKNILTGKLNDEDTGDRADGLGAGYVLFYRGATAAFIHGPDIDKVFGHDLVKQNMNKYVANVRHFPTACGMATTATYVHYPPASKQATNIHEWFMPSSGSAVSSPNQSAYLRTAEDEEKTQEADRNIQKFLMYFCGGKVNFQDCTVTELKRPKVTKSMQDVLNASRSQRLGRLTDMFKQEFNDTSENGDIANIRSQVTMHVFSSVLGTMCLSGNFSDTPLVATQVGAATSINVLAFLPQSKNSLLVQQAIADEQAKRAAKAAHYATKEEKLVLAQLGRVEDVDSVIKTIVNMLTWSRAVVRLYEMKIEGFPCTVAEIFEEILKWVLLQKRKLDKWQAHFDDRLDHLYAVFLSLMDNVMSHFGAFIKDMGNVDIFIDSEEYLPEMNVKHLEKALRSFKAQRDYFQLLQDQHVPHTVKPALLNFLGGNDASPKVSEKSEQEPPQKRTKVAGNSSTVNPNVARRTDQSSTNSGGKSPPRGKPSTKQLGIFHLHEGKTPDDILPDGVDICPYFASRGWDCFNPDEGCTSRHCRNLHELGVAKTKSVFNHLRTSGAGYVNKFRCKGVPQDILERNTSLIGTKEGTQAPVIEEREARVQSWEPPEDGYVSFERDLSRVGYNSYRNAMLSKPSSSLSKASSQTSPHRPSSLQRSPVSVQPPRKRQRSSQPLKLDGEGPQTRLITHASQKDEILSTFQEKWGKNFAAPVVTVTEGKPLFRPYASLPNQSQLVSAGPIPPQQDKSYSVAVPTFPLSILPIIASGVLDINDYGALTLLNKKFSKLIPLHLRLLDVDVRPILQPRWDFDEQEQLQQERIDMATALFIHYGGDPSKLVRALNHEYVLASLDREAILQNVKGVVSPEDLHHIQRILYQGCPAELNFEEPNDERDKWFRRGNQPSYTCNSDAARKTLNKEDKRSHVIPIHQDVVEFSFYCRHTPQGMVVKKNASPRVVWDGSSKYAVDDVPMNEVSPIENEAPITFGTVEAEFDKYVYDLRVSYPEENILLAMVDISSCFRFGRIPPELTGAFGFLAGDSVYCLANAMVFGHRASANSWEPFRRAIESLTAVLASSPDAEKLVEKHRAYLDMLQWDDTKSDSYTKAKACPLCPGVFTSDGKEITHKTKFYVDDGLLAAINRRRMEILLAVTIEAIFMVMGNPNPRLRTCPLSLEKWKKMMIAPRQICLGLQYDAVALTKGTTIEYRADLLSMLNERWPAGRCFFTAKEAHTLVGKLARLAKGAKWVYHILTHLYDQIALALASNRRILAVSSPSFRNYVRRIRTQQMGGDKLSKDGARIISFALKKAAQLIHGLKQNYRISPQMREDIEFFRRALDPSSNISWQMPLAHVVLRTALALLFGDSSLSSAGGYSLGLKYWWHVAFPEEIIAKTLLHLRNDDTENLISINALEFVTVILSYCAALTALTDEHLEDDPHPVVLAITDNTSALNWTNHACKRSRLGKELARFFVGLLIDSPLGINAEWISTDENKIADDISRLKKESVTPSNPYPSFDYSLLPQRYPTLAPCRRWVPTSHLLSTIWGILLSGKSPDLETIKKLKQNGLGRLIT